MSLRQQELIDTASLTFTIHVCELQLAESSYHSHGGLYEKDSCVYFFDHHGDPVN